MKYEKGFHKRESLFAELKQMFHIYVLIICLIGGNYV